MSALAAVLLGVVLSGASPELHSVLPRGGQRGTEIEVELRGRRLDDAQEILFHDAGGIEVLSLEVQDANRARARLKIAPECRLGEHSLRVRTAGGVTPLRTFWVGHLPQIDEVEDNGKFHEPQRIELNRTVHGRVRSEDIDYYAVEVLAGQRLSVECEGLRLGETLFDPFVAILDAKRFELAACDDSALLLQDPVLSVVVPEDGRYVVAVRDASFGGSDSSWYRLHVGTFPRPTALYPPGGKVGETMTLRFLGDPAGELQAERTLPELSVLNHPVFPDGAEIGPPSPNGLRVWAYDNHLEQEPNDSYRGLSTIEQELPLALNGILEKPGDHDWFRFRASKGAKYRFMVLGRRLRSPIDSVINVYQYEGEDDRIKHLVGNDDDNRQPDSALDFTAPVDGEYAIRVRDHLSRGGPTFVYRVEIRPADPLGIVSLPTFGRDSQARKQIAVPRGNRYATVINVTRQNVGGKAVLRAEGLPAGVTMRAEEYPANVNQLPVVFEASADAPLSGEMVDLGFELEGRPDLRTVYYQDSQLVTGEPNRTVYYRSITDELPVVVSEEAPFHLELVPPSVPLVRNGSMNLLVRAHRQEGFDGPINVRFLWKPPGVGARATVQIPKGKDEAHYPINANASARLATWKIAVLGEADAGKGQLLVSSELTPLTIAEPFLGMAIEMTALEQGQAGEVLCKLSQNKPFEGKAQVRLYGLPAEVSAPALEITSADTELVFPIQTTAKSPNGQHKNLFCQVVVPLPGGGVAHNMGHGGVLRIDPPPPKPKAVAKAEPEKPAPAAKPEKKKRLSRLEKLRQQAAEAREVESSDEKESGQQGAEEPPAGTGGAR